MVSKIVKNQQKIIGTLVPISALGEGTFASGLVFLNWLKKNHQTAWQILPLYQTQLEPGSSSKHIPSPYKGYGIGLDPKYLPANFTNIHPTEQEKSDFIKANGEWIDDYALFCALRDHFGTDDWREWGQGLRGRNPEMLSEWRDKLAREIDAHVIEQWKLHKSYTLIRSKAKELGILLIGDLPFYLSLQSPLVWAHQEAFQIEKDGDMRYVSGVPDAPEAHFGRQVWGHPLYDWKNQQKVIEFWKIRLRYQKTLFDNIRLDHAKAFFSYGAMDTTSKQDDRYEEGPGDQVFEELIRFVENQGVSIFTEDSGDKTQDLRDTLRKLNVAGIKILRFALKRGESTIIKKYADISGYPENCVAYTTTHDTETLLGYLQGLTAEQKKKLAKVAGVVYAPSDRDLALNLRSAILASNAHIVIIPIQDWLLITDRINIPGTELPINDPNWNFKLTTPIEELSIEN